MPRALARNGTKTTIAAALLLAANFFASSEAFALPSYAQQTGMPCSQCHTIAFGPALTSYGRQFKLNGYTFGDEKHAVPFALMVVTGYSHTATDLPEAPAPHFSTNNNVAVNEVTGFFAGRITEHSGAFIEAAYSGVERHTAWGAFDLRYARALTIGGKGVVAGISLNNNPTVTDLWNSTPVWSFPYTGSELAPTPGAAPLLFDGISERVLGPSAYVMINDKLYLEAGAYKAMSDRWLSNVGLTADDNLHMNGVAPYWRAVMQFERGPSYYSVGIVGLDAKLQPDPSVPATDHYRDIGLDATYQYTDGGKYAIQANLSYVHEKRSLDASFAAEASDAVENHLDSLHFDAGFAWDQTWVASVGWFNTSGSSNSALFAPAEVEGSATGSPDSRGYTIQLEYVAFGKIHSFLRPWLNLRLGLQYIGYNRFNGSNTNYDGFGRSASDNNTLFGFAWVAF